MKVTRLKVSITNCYVLEGSSGSVLVDTPPPGGGEKCLKMMKKAGIDPGSVTLIAITHGHFDHTGGADYLKEVTGAEVLGHIGDISGGVSRRDTKLRSTGWGKLLLQLSPMIYRDMKGGARVSIVMRESELDLREFLSEELIALHTPGHTPGSITLLSGKKAFVGDMVMNGPPFTLLPRVGIFAEDPEMMARSLKLLIRRGAEVLYPGHGKPFLVQRLSWR